jgi:hypothetical protein
MNGILFAALIASVMLGLVWLWNNKSGFLNRSRPDLNPDEKDNRRFDDI